MSRTPEGEDSALIVVTAADGATVAASLFGGQVTHWRSADDVERLYLSPSPRASLEAIRGGVPVVFPQFADRGPLPKHGIARTATWRLQARGIRADGAGQMRLVLDSSAATRALWPYDFSLALDITVLAGWLQLDLRVINRGTEAFAFACALHTYLRMHPPAHVHVDVAAAVGASPTGSRHTVSIDGPVTTILESVTAAHLEQSSGALDMHQHGFRDAVVWNPGPDARIPGLPADGFRHFVCIESALIERPLLLAGGAHWHGSQSLRARVT